MLTQRTGGILLHFTSLPGNYGAGDLGPQAFRFADFLSRAGQHYWQVLPINPTSPLGRYSPYDCYSAFAGNPLLIDPEELYREGWLSKKDIADAAVPSTDRAQFQAAHRIKRRLFQAAFQRVSQSTTVRAKFDQFVRENQDWLEDFVLFVALRRRFRRNPWTQWPRQLRDRSKPALKQAAEELKNELACERFLQFIFYRQYFKLRAYCHSRGVRIIGDIPIYVQHDSADVWACPDAFQLRSDKRPQYIAGVPPDYFSRTGQLWGNPVYNWDWLKKSHFHWWMRRIRHNLRLFDQVRIDHFRGLIAYWRVPAGHKNAIRGKWIHVPYQDFFKEMLQRFPSAPVIAEDLGNITPDVRQAIIDYNFPCMRVLQFAFGGDPAKNIHRPYLHVENGLVYTGTHDNNTTRGWFENDLTAEQKKNLIAFLGGRIRTDEIAWELIRQAMMSVAKIAVIPMQDVLNLDGRARMNHPGKKRGNWLWRMRPGAASKSVAHRFRALVAASGRL
ncbi:MAG: 4-alpha-glucanotransferase [Sedimentisphaerales bacterium]|nr:4-alpha-glucanotransferase [Sedimentisphaerales bacterium]